MRVFHYIRKGKKGDYSPEELQKYIKIEYIERHMNWTAYPPVFIEKKIKARYCDADDFGEHE